MNMNFSRFLSHYFYYCAKAGAISAMLPALFFASIEISALYFGEPSSYLTSLLYWLELTFFLFFVPTLANCFLGYFFYLFYKTQGDRPLSNSLRFFAVPLIYAVSSFVFSGYISVFLFMSGQIEYYLPNLYETLGVLFIPHPELEEISYSLYNPLLYVGSMAFPPGLIITFFLLLGGLMVFLKGMHRLALNAKEAA